MYTVTEKELISTVETQNECRTILLGRILSIYTDHKNRACNNFNTDRVLRCILKLEEYDTEIEYIKGDEIYSCRRTINISL